MLQPEASRGQPLAGFTLLEVSLILAIGTAAATAGLKLYQGHKQALDLQVSETRIKTMFQALGSFYAMHCLTVANSQGQAKATPEPLLSSEVLVFHSNFLYIVIFIVNKNLAIFYNYFYDNVRCASLVQLVER